MWHWLHKSVWVRNLSYTARISIISSCILHGALLLFFLIIHLMRPVTRIQVYKDLDLTKAVTIIIDPSSPKNGPASHQKIAAQQASSASSKNNNVVSPGTNLVAEKKVQAKKNTASAQKKKQPAKKTVPKEKPVAQKPTVPKKVAQKPKPEPKKTEQKKSKEPAPLPETKKPEAATSIPNIKKTESEKQVQSVATNPTPNTPPMAGYLIASSASEAATLTVALAIQEELLRVWHPPVGTEDGISCVVQVTLDAQGKLTEFAIKKSSGFLLFDVSARAAIQQAVWPQAVWGTILELCLQ